MQLFWGVIIMGIFSPFWLYPAYGDEPHDLNASRVVRLIIPGPPGATFDRYGRLVARHIGRFLPGQPTVVAQNMPGASGRVALKYLCSRAPQDGSVIGLMLKQVPLMQRLDEPVPCDTTKLHYIGSPSRLPETLVVWHQAPMRSIFDRQEISVGATTTAGASFIMPKLANAVLGTKFKLVTGYTGGPQINLAMDRGEVEARSSEPWSEWKATKPDWILEGKIIPILQMGMTKTPDLPRVPLLIELAFDEGPAALASLTTEISRPIVAPPGVSDSQVRALEHAFRRTMTDPDFLADAAKMNAEINPIYSDELTELVRRVMAAPPDAVGRLKAALAAKE